MASAYGLGVFNDNFFKQAVMLIAVYIGKPELQNLAVIIFTLPWLLFAAPAGWLADRFSKGKIVIAAKLLELVAMGFGAAGVLLLSWPLIMVMMFLMALQSTIFSPALNGSIPELYPEDYVVVANSRLKGLVMAANLVGIILAGILLKYKAPLWGVPLGQMLVAVGVVTISLIGLFASLGVVKRPAANPQARFPWTGPIDTVRTLWNFRHDKLLAIIVAADSFVWFVAVLQILIINQLGQSMFGFNEQQTSYLLVTELLGVGAGGLLAGKLAHNGRWRRLLVPAMLALTLATGMVAMSQIIPEAIQLTWVASWLVLAGIAGGVLLVPMESFFQTRPAPKHKGAVIAAANFAGFAGMMLSGAVELGLQASNIAPSHRFGLIAGVCLIAAILLRRGLHSIPDGHGDLTQGDLS